jgi:hypothetical protein
MVDPDDPPTRSRRIAPIPASASVQASSVANAHAASALHQKKLIDYIRGNIRILNRKRLEAAACTCYGIAKNLQDVAQV